MMLSNNSVSNIVEVFVTKMRGNIGDNIFENRKCIIDSYDDKVDVSIGIVAYNRLDITKLCVESVIKYTKNINYKLILVYNENTQGDGILEYYKSIDYNNKIIIHIKDNLGAPLAYQQIYKYIEGKYFVHLPNDVIVTNNWLSNLIICAESDDRIGMVNPVSSNVSNLQQVDLEFSNYSEMQNAAAEYNISDSRKWQERIRLITLGTLFKRECLATIGDIFDIGFTHDFGDDDISFRVRRSGYKLMLACDTWVHHAHEVNERNYYDLEKGRLCFKSKFFGIDAWDDVNNYIPDVIKKIRKPFVRESTSILGVDVKCGTPILEIKNKLRSFGVYDSECCASTTDGRYFIDLQTICGTENVVSCDSADIHKYFLPESFNYIVIGDSINQYSEFYDLIKSVYYLLKKGGQLFLFLKNVNDIYNLLNIIGHREIVTNSNVYNVTLEMFIENLTKLGIFPEYIGNVLHRSVPDEYIAIVNSKIELLYKQNIEETITRLTSDKFVLLIQK